MCQTAAFANSTVKDLLRGNVYIACMHLSCLATCHAVSTQIHSAELEGLKNFACLQKNFDCLQKNFDCLKASGWVAASRLICCWTPEETRGASLGSLAFAARVSLDVDVK